MGLFPLASPTIPSKSRDQASQPLTSGADFLNTEDQENLITVTWGTGQVGAIGVINEGAEAVLRLHQPGSWAGSRSLRPTGYFFLEVTCFPRAGWQGGQFLKA